MFEQIESQIAFLRRQAGMIHIGDTMQALLDLARASDVWRRSDDPGHSSACSEDAFCEVSYAYCEACKLRDALDKLKEITGEQNDE